MAITSANGNFRFAGLPPGNYSLSFFLQGYAPLKQKEIRVAAGERVQINIMLEPASNDGSMFGTVTDENGRALEGVIVTAESDHIPQLENRTNPDGAFRFEGLPDGEYRLIFKKKGYPELKRERMELASGSKLEVNVQLLPKPAPAKKVNASIERKSTGIVWTYSSDYLRLIPNNKSIYSLLDQTLAIDTDTFSTVHSDPSDVSGQYATVVARGGDYFSTVWNYDGLNIRVPDTFNPAGDWKGDFPSFFDLENAEQVQIITAGNDISIPTGGVTVNVISRQGGRSWHGAGTFFYSDDGLQSDNTPQEAQGDPRITTTLARRLDKLQEYGFYVGGPIIHDKLFISGSLYRGWLDRLNLDDNLEENKSTSYGLNANWNLSTNQHFQFGFYKADHEGSGAAHKTTTILPGVWTAQYNWAADDNTLLKAQYGYVGAGAQVEFTFEQKAHDVSLELDRFVENLLGGDHELRFGFEYKTSHFRDSCCGLPDPEFESFSLRDNNAGSDVPLASGSFTIAYFSEEPALATITRTSLYSSDFFRKGRLTLDLGLRIDRQTGKNEPHFYPSPLQNGEIAEFLGPGFEELLPPVVYPGKDPGIAFDDLSPRVGATYELMKGRTLVFGRFAKYYGPYDRTLLAFTGNGTPFAGIELSPIFFADYNDLNNDGIITPNEISNSALTNYKDELAKRIYDSDLTNPYINESVIGVQTRLFNEWSFSAAFTHRSYHDLVIESLFDLTTDFFHFNGTRVLHTAFGDFVVPFFTADPIEETGARILRNNRSYTQTYDGLELILDKAMANNFMFRGVPL